MFPKIVRKQGHVHIEMSEHIFNCLMRDLQMAAWDAKMQPTYVMELRDIVDCLKHEAVKNGAKESDGEVYFETDIR
jgi:hypothetical protein